MVPGDVSITEAQTVTLVPSSPVTTAVDTLTVASEDDLTIKVTDGDGGTGSVTG